jgi:hypothetical protein
LFGISLDKNKSAGRLENIYSISFFIAATAAVQNILKNDWIPNKQNDDTKIKENNPVKGRSPNGTLRPITKHQITNNHQLPNHNNQTKE